MRGKPYWLHDEWSEAPRVFGIDDALLIAGLALAVGSTVGQVVSQNKQAEKQEEAQELAEKQEKDRLRRMQMQAFEKGRILRASAESQVASSGAGDAGSSAFGGPFSVTSQANSNINAAQSAISYSTHMNDIFSQASSYGNQANLWGAGAPIGMTVASASSRFGGSATPKDEGLVRLEAKEVT